MKKTPWDQVIARFLVRPLVNTGVRPNHITAVTLIMALSAGILFALNDLALNHWAAGIFVASRFLDHFDGELARLQGSETEKMPMTRVFRKWQPRLWHQLPRS